MKILIKTWSRERARDVIHMGSITVKLKIQLKYLEYFEDKETETEGDLERRRCIGPPWWNGFGCKQGSRERCRPHLDGIKGSLCHVRIQYALCGAIRGPNSPLPTQAGIGARVLLPQGWGSLEPSATDFCPGQCPIGHQGQPNMQGRT